MACHLAHSLFFVIFLFLEPISVVLADCGCGPPIPFFKAEYATAKLPTPLLRPQLHYDGKNSIYIFGDITGDYAAYDASQILRYDVWSDTIEEVGRMPSEGTLTLWSSVQAVDNDIYFFGAFEYGFGSINVIKFDTITRTATQVFKLPPNYSHVSFKMQAASSIVYILLQEEITANSSISRLYEYNMKTYTNKTVAEIRNLNDNLNSIVIDDHAFIFGRDRSTKEKQILRIDLKSFEIVKIWNEYNMYQEPRIFEPRFSVDIYSSTVSDGVRGYMIARDSDSDVLIEFNPKSFAWVPMHVENFPSGPDEDDLYDVPPSTVYVDKLNRIYFFGGARMNVSGFLDEIWYIELRPSLVPFFCVDKRNGMYPHPNFCSKFLGCRDGVRTEFRCQPPLLFDPLIKTCRHPETVNCEVSCTGKPNGNYPHPNNCSSFIQCHEEVLDVYQCSTPLLFDPLLHICNYPDLVQCGNSTSV